MVDNHSLHLGDVVRDQLSLTFPRIFNYASWLLATSQICSQFLLLWCWSHSMVLPTKPSSTSMVSFSDYSGCGCLFFCQIYQHYPLFFFNFLFLSISIHIFHCLMVLFLFTFRSFFSSFYCPKRQLKTTYWENREDQHYVCWVWTPSGR